MLLGAVTACLRTFQLATFAIVHLESLGAFLLARLFWLPSMIAAAWLVEVRQSF